MDAEERRLQQKKQLKTAVRLVPSSSVKQSTAQTKKSAHTERQVRFDVPSESQQEKQLHTDGASQSAAIEGNSERTAEARHNVSAAASHSENTDTLDASSSRLGAHEEDLGTQGASQQQQHNRKRKRPKSEPYPAEGDSIASRRSTRTTVADINAKREEDRIERDWMKSSQQKQQRKSQKQREQQQQLTQDKLIDDAAYTEILNQRWLEVFLQKEEASKIQHDGHDKRKKIDGPVIGYRSSAKRGTYYSVLDEKFLVPCAQLKRRPSEAHKPVCAVSGSYARYRDPKTGLPFADIASFKELRKRADHEKQNQCSERRKLLGVHFAGRVDPAFCWPQKKQRTRRRRARADATPLQAFLPSVYGTQPSYHINLCEERRKVAEVPTSSSVAS